MSVTIVVSLTNVVTEVLAPEGDGKWREYVGGYTEWFTQRQQENDPFAAAKTEKKAEKTEKPGKTKNLVMSSRKNKTLLAGSPRT